MRSIFGTLEPMEGEVVRSRSILRSSALVFCVVSLAALVIGGATLGWLHVTERLAQVEGLVREGAALAAVERASIEETYLLLREELAQVRSELAQTEEERQEALRTIESLTQERATVQTQLGSLSRQLQDQERTLSQPGVSAIVGSWRPRVAHITCAFRLSGGRTGRSSGSAVATLESGVPVFLTNAHIVYVDGGLRPESCQATFPDRNVTITIPGSAIVIPNARTDIAWMTVPAAARAQVGIATAFSRCTATPSIGDAVVILGFPSVGSTESITATEGIVSGFDNGMYITSAKIERGNSGGAAIHLTQNCFLGIPTLAVSGPLESLARILPVR
jgi:S1-C subfamily serine protease